MQIFYHGTSREINSLHSPDLYSEIGSTFLRSQNYVPYLSNKMKDNYLHEKRKKEA